MTSKKPVALFSDVIMVHGGPRLRDRRHSPYVLERDGRSRVAVHHVDTGVEIELTSDFDVNVAWGVGPGGGSAAARGRQRPQAGRHPAHFRPRLFVLAEAGMKNASCRRRPEGGRGLRDLAAGGPPLVRPRRGGGARHGRLPPERRDVTGRRPRGETGRVLKDLRILGPPRLDSSIGLLDLLESRITLAIARPETGSGGLGICLRDPHGRCGAGAVLRAPGPAPHTGVPSCTSPGGVGEPPLSLPHSRPSSGPRGRVLGAGLRPDGDRRVVESALEKREAAGEVGGKQADGAPWRGRSTCGCGCRGPRTAAARSTWRGRGAPSGGARRRGHGRRIRAHPRPRHGAAGHPRPAGRDALEAVQGETEMLLYITAEDVFGSGTPERRGPRPSTPSRRR